MTWTVQWRTRAHLDDAVFVVDEDGSTRDFIPATPSVLSTFLTSMAEMAPNGQKAVEQDKRNPEQWGELVLARASSGEVLEVEPELFWHGIYSWFRSRGIDFDTPGLPAEIPLKEAPALRLSTLMDD